LVEIACVFVKTASPSSEVKPISEVRTPPRFILLFRCCSDSENGGQKRCQWLNQW
jgi:hypothetical protein